MARKKSFNELFTQLESIVQNMESGELDLEKSVKLFEEGVSLAEQIREQLSGAEQKITELMNKLEKNTN